MGLLECHTHHLATCPSPPAQHTVANRRRQKRPKTSVHMSRPGLRDRQSLLSLLEPALLESVTMQEGGRCADGM